DNARDAYAPAPPAPPGAKGDLDAWEAALPNETWALVDSYESAVETLAALKKIDPTDLADQLDADEKAYVDALAAERANERAVIALSAFTHGRRERASIATQMAPARLLGALRGDD
ncbi:MAG: hypothetical protein M3540_12600, partial [Actinomycetota bacterium]|nr:hypothetical protein [Actinomycetota bacterium]